MRSTWSSVSTLLVLTITELTRYVDCVGDKEEYKTAQVISDHFQTSFRKYKQDPTLPSRPWNTLSTDLSLVPIGREITPPEFTRQCNWAQSYVAREHEGAMIDPSSSVTADVALTNHLRFYAVSSQFARVS